MNEVEILSKINSCLVETGNAPFKNIKEVRKGEAKAFNPLTYVLKQKEIRAIKLTDNEMDFLIENSDLFFMNEFGETALSSAIAYSERYQLTERQYIKLINDCPQSSKNYNMDTCDLITALIFPNLKFTAEMWKTLIRKTDKQHFNNKPFLLSGILMRAAEKKTNIIEPDILANKLDVEHLQEYPFFREIMYSIAKHNQIALGVKIVERAALEKKDIEKFMGKFKGNNVSFAGQKSEILEKVNKIIDIAYTKAAIAGEVDKSERSNKLKI